MKTSRYTGMIAVVLALLTAGSAAAQIAGVITTTEGRRIEGVIKWKIREKVYGITARGGNIELDMAPANIGELRIPRPKELDAAEKAIRQGQASTAIPLLEKLAADYLMLQWDKPATKLLAEAYLAAGQADKARRVCETVIALNPEAAYLGEMAPAYWQALLKLDRSAKVEDLMGKAIKSGDRTASAYALNMRGDVILSGGDTHEIARQALRDGYLRVITLYKSEKGPQPEALYKAAKCFEKLGQTARADQLRSTLKSAFGSSEWARKP